MDNLEIIEIRPATKQRHCIIWMHGLGADGHDFVPIIPKLELPEKHGIGFVFPNAPVQPVSINNGLKMRSWYDILAVGRNRKINEEDVFLSCQAITQLIQQEVARGIAPEHIILAGFSQGGAIALHTALTHPARLAGVLALSTCLPTLERIRPKLSDANRCIPILMAHGTMDQMISINVAKETYQSIKALHYPISWHQYPMQHSLCEQEIKVISHYICSVFGLLV